MTLGLQVLLSSALPGFPVLLQAALACEYITCWGTWHLLLASLTDNANGLLHLLIRAVA